MHDAVLYEVPMATPSIRLIMIGVCLLFVVAIFGFWLPRAVPRLLKLRASGAQKVVAVVLALLPLVIGLGPLGVLIALIRSPTAYVTDTGVMQESVLSQTPTVLAWSEIAHVTCRLASTGTPRWFDPVATD